ncbi:MAG: ThuA domain-containing protein [Phycisphaerae bacterium]|nr:ThuA domain-containing protein [Phycisphaerae bacterium]
MPCHSGIIGGVAAAAIAALGIGPRAHAQNVYVFSTDNINGNVNDALQATLTAQGFNVTMGVRANLFDGSISLAGYDAVFMTCSLFSPFAVPNVAGQQQLVDFVNAGGGLVTSEILNYMHYHFSSVHALFPILPATYPGWGPHNSATTFSLITPDPIMNAGLPASFAIPNSLGDGEYRLAPKAGATEFYRSSNTGGAGVVGWDAGAGRVASLSHQFSNTGVITDANYAQLLGNTVRWVIPAPGAAALLGLGGLLAARRRR